MTDQIGQSADGMERPTCYECDAPAIGIFEGVVPPAGTVRQPACEEHGLDLPPVRSFTRVGHAIEDGDEVDVYAGRGSGRKAMGEVDVGERGWLGNPYTVEEHGREKSIERFEREFKQRLQTDEPEGFRDAVAELSGKVLGCWCQTLDEHEPACHAEIIAAHADRISREQSADTDRTEVTRDE
jgi:hypothetical protein